MSPEARRFHERSCSWRYRRWGTRGVCYYCGCLADSEDHIPPVSLAPVEPDDCEDMAFWLVPACRDCNSALGNLPVLLIGARKEHLARHYRRKYRKELATPEWTPEELDGLGPNIRSKVEAGIAVRDAVLARIGVLERECIEPTLEDYRDRVAANQPMRAVSAA